MIKKWHKNLNWVKFFFFFNRLSPWRWLAALRFKMAIQPISSLDRRVQRPGNNSYNQANTVELLRKGVYVLFILFETYGLNRMDYNTKISLWNLFQACCRCNKRPSFNIVSDPGSRSPQGVVSFSQTGRERKCSSNFSLNLVVVV